MGKGKEIAEGAIISSIFLVILLLSFYTPLGLVTIYMIPVPFIIYCYRNGLKSSFWLFAVNIFLATIFTGIYGFFPVFMAGTTGLVMGSLYQKGNALAAIVGGIIINIINFIIALGFFRIVFKVNFVTIVKETLFNTLNASKTILAQFGGKEQVEAMFQLYHNFIDNIGMVLPFIFITYALFIVFINHVLAGLIMRKLGLKVPGLKPLREWMFPKSILIYYLITVIIININSLYTIYYIKLVVVNLFPLLQLILMIQGVSFVFFYAYYKKMGKTLPVLSIISLFIPVLSQVIHIIGLVDLGFNLRNKLKT